MVIALLFVGLLTGMIGFGVSLFFGFGWVVAFGGYMLGSMIGSGCVIAIALFRDDRHGGQQHATQDTAAHAIRS